MPMRCNWCKATSKGDAITAEKLSTGEVSTGARIKARDLRANAIFAVGLVIRRQIAGRMKQMQAKNLRIGEESSTTTMNLQMHK